MRVAFSALRLQRRGSQFWNPIPSGRFFSQVFLSGESSFLRLEERQGAEMAQYVMVESRDPFESRDVSYFYNVAANLAGNGDQVTVLD